MEHQIDDFPLWLIELPANAHGKTAEEDSNEAIWEMSQWKNRWCELKNETKRSDHGELESNKHVKGWFGTQILRTKFISFR